MLTTIVSAFWLIDTQEMRLQIFINIFDLYQGYITWEVPCPFWARVVLYPILVVITEYDVINTL